MNTYFSSLLLGMIARAVFSAIFIMPIVWFITPWAYAALVWLLLFGIIDNHRAHKNLKAIKKSLDTIESIFEDACLDNHFHTHHQHTLSLQTLQSQSLLGLIETQKLLEKVLQLKAEATQFQAKEKERKENESAAYARFRKEQRANRANAFKGSMIIEPIPDMNMVIAHVLSDKRLKAPKFTFGSADYRKQLIHNLSVAYSARYEVSKQTVFNLVMGRLASGSLKQAA